jgi:hypothetical protein
MKPNSAPDRIGPPSFSPLELFILRHYEESFDALADQLNRTPRGIEQVVDRIFAKLRKAGAFDTQPSNL